MPRPLRSLAFLLPMSLALAGVAPFADQMLIETVGRLRKVVETGKPE